MSFAFSFEVGVDIVACPEEASASALAFTVVALEAPEVAAELAYGLVGEPPPRTLSSSVGHEDG